MLTALTRQRKIPAGLAAAFVVVVILPSALLAVLGIRLLEQDRALEDRRRHELAESALERATTFLQQDIAAIQHRLTATGGWTGPTPASDAVLINNSRGPVLYLPNPRSLPEPPAEAFLEADQAEFQTGNTARVLEICARLAVSPSPAIRAGALLRIARIHRKAGRLEHALAAWSRLTSIPDVAIAGEPVGLLAHRARCRALEESGRVAELRDEARRLLDGLYSARWPVDRETFLLVSQQARQWFGRDEQPPPIMLAQADALSTLWPQRKTPEGSLCRDGFTLVWNGENALLAGPGFRAEHWQSPSRVTLHCAGEPAASGGITRASTVTALPWSITVALDKQPLPEFASRRTALLAAVPVLMVLLCAVTYFAWRAISRELAAARLQSEFVASVSHEFRTPLTSLRQFNEMLTDEPQLPAETRLSYYRAQGRATDRLSRLVETLLDFGRMEAGRRPYRLEPTDAGAVVREVSAEFAAEPAARGFAIDCRTPEQPLPVEADREALGRAIWNLLDNAVKYSGDRRDVLIEAVANASGVAILVVDRGLGIPQHEQARLFQRFVRGESVRQRGIPGTGIGLAMVRHIAEAHGGRVELASVEGEGSTFSLLLPGKRVGWRVS